MTRYAGPVRLRLSSPADSAHVDRGRKLLGELEARPDVGALQRTLADGTVIAATRQGGQRTIEVRSPSSNPRQGERVEEIIYCYISSDDGLRVYDLGRKSLLQVVTGLDPYEVEDATRDGKVVYMTGLGLVARVDVAALSAFGYSYEITGPGGSDPTGFAYPETCRLNASQDRALVYFHETLSGEGGLIAGVPGTLLVDADTLAPLRPAIRMARADGALAWTPDGERFLLSTALGTDPGDVFNAGVYTSTADYLAVFDKHGALQGVRQLAFWSFTPNAGFQSLITAVAATNTRAYVVYQEDFNIASYPQKLAAIDLTDPDLPVVATVALPTFLPTLASALHVSYGGGRAAVWYSNAVGVDSHVIEIDLRDDALAIVSTNQDSRFTIGTAWNGYFCGTPKISAIRSGPKSQFGQPPDPRRWMLRHDGVTPMLYAYREFADPPVFEFDFNALQVGKRYALASAGWRKLPEP